jgi:hypothetical protein
LQVDLTALRFNTDTDILSSSARLDLRSKELKRARDLREKSSISKAEFEDAEIEERLTRIALDRAKVDRQLTEIEHKQARAVLERRSIRSPVSGVVMSVDANPGEYAHEQLAIMRIAVIDPLYVEVFVPVSYYGQIRMGQLLEVSPSPPLTGGYQANVIAIDRVFDTSSGTFGMRLGLSNPKGDIPAGVRCTVDLGGDTKGQFLESYDDGRADLFKGARKGSWNVAGGDYFGKPGEDGIGFSMFDPYGLESVSRTNALVTPGGNLRVSVAVATEDTAGIVFDALDKDQFGFVVLNFAKGEIQLGHNDPKLGWVTDSSVAYDLKKGKAYDYSVSIDEKTVSVEINGADAHRFKLEKRAGRGTAGLVAKDGPAKFSTTFITTEDSLPAPAKSQIGRQIRSENKSVDDLGGEDLQSQIDEVIRNAENAKVPPKK